MIIIKGGRGKYKVVEDIIKSMNSNHNIAVIDTLGVIELEGADHFLFNQYRSTDAIDIYKTGWFSDYEWVIFYINIYEENFDIEEFKKVDKSTYQNLIVTVQTKDDQDIEIKFI